MSKRSKEWAKRERRRVMMLLRCRCNACGQTEDLELDCIRAMGHAHHGKSTDQRMSFYRAQLRVGNLQILCGTCNAMKGGGTMAELLERLNNLKGSETHSSNNRVGEYCEQLTAPQSPREDISL